MSRPLRTHAPLSLAPCALLLLLDCGIVRGPRVDSESHFLGCSSEVDCAGIAGATCANGWCVDIETGDGILPNALDGASGEQPAGEPVGANEPAGPSFEPGESGAGGDLSAQPDPGPPAARDCTTRDLPIEGQAGLDRLEGCENIYGNLELAFADPDLRPLHALRKLFGNLSLNPLPQLQSSLEGLENLEQVSGSVHLMELSQSTLASLAGLRSVGSSPDDGLWLDTSPSLRDLGALGNLAELHNLALTGLPELESLAALHLSRQMRTVTLQAVPRLSSAQALYGVEQIERLFLEDTGLERLDFLAARRVGELRLTDNSALVDATVSSAERILIQGNTSLTGLSLPPQLPGLRRLEIRANPALQTVTGLAQLVLVAELSVSDNPALSSLSLPGLQTLYDLEVLRNPSLTSIELPVLTASVQNAIIVSNVSLPPDSLPPVLAAAYTKLGGNQGDAVGLDPCPYQRDGYCDAPPVDTLCAAGTDRYDCGESE